MHKDIILVHNATYDFTIWTFGKYMYNLYQLLYNSGERNPVEIKGVSEKKIIFTILYIISIKEFYLQHIHKAFHFCK